MIDEIRPEDYFFLDDEPLPPENYEETIENRLYCFPRIGMLTVGRKLVVKDPKAVVISISSSTDTCPSLSELGTLDEERVLRLKFDDIGPEGRGICDFPPFPITMPQAESIVNFIEKHVNTPGVNFYIHCDAGVSRSQAIVRFILDFYGGEERWRTLKNNPPLTPNMWVLSCLKRVLWNLKFKNETDEKEEKN